MDSFDNKKSLPKYGKLLTSCKGYLTSQHTTF